MILVYNNPRFGWFGKKVKFRNIFLMALDIQIGQSGASSPIWMPPDQLVLPFLPPSRIGQL